MTNPNGSDPGSGGGGGVPELTPEMVMQGCVNLHRKYMYAALVKICGDTSQKTTDGLWECILNDISNRAIKERWAYHRHDLRELCKLAVCELHSPKQFDSDEKRGIAISIATGRIIIGEEYRKKYKRYYEIIYSQADDYSHVAISHLAKTLGE